METEAKKYELGYLLNPMTPADQLESVIEDNISRLIKAGGGEILTGPIPQLKELSYPIKKDTGNSKTTFKNAYFGHMQFMLDPSALPQLNEALTKDESLIRHLLIIAPKIAVKKVKSKPGREAKEETGPAVKAPEAALSDENQVVNDQELDRKIEGLLSSEV